MAEIKLNDGFSAEVQTFRATGEALDSVNTNSSDFAPGASPLPTVEGYTGMMSRIRTQIRNLQLLVKKDAEDMDALAARLKAADAS